MNKIIFLSLAICAVCSMSASTGYDSGPSKSTGNEIPFVGHGNEFIKPTEICFCNINENVYEYNGYDVVGVMSNPVVFDVPEFEKQVPSVIGVPDTKRHFPWLFSTVQKLC